MLVASVTKVDTGKFVVINRGEGNVVAVAERHAAVQEKEARYYRELQEAIESEQAVGDN